MRVVLEVSYDGTDFEGWQRQPGGKRTVQATIEEALFQLLGHQVSLLGASRTDSGVHAQQQFLHFDTDVDVTKFKDFCAGLQVKLPPDVSVQNLWHAPDDFNTCRDVIRKTYQYVIHASRRPNALERRYSYWMKWGMNLDRLQSYADQIIGTHDFSSFRNAGGSAKTTIRKIESARWFQLENNKFVFEITANGFLKQMIRNLVGTMTQLDRNQAKPIEFQKILESRDRLKALMTAPAEGLFLVRIEYPEPLDNRCRKL